MQMGCPSGHELMSSCFGAAPEPYGAAPLMAFLLGSLLRIALTTCLNMTHPDRILASPQNVKSVRFPIVYELNVI